MWNCPRCGEPNEPQFTSCWKCARADEEALRRAPGDRELHPNAEMPDVFFVKPPVLPAPGEPVVRMTSERTVRCPTCGDVFKVGL